MEPRFSTKQLRMAALASVFFVILALGGLALIGDLFNLTTSDAASAVVNSVALWMGVVGILVLGFGLFFVAAEMSVPKASADVAAATPKRVSFRKAAGGAAAALVVGMVLVAMSGVVAWQSSDTGSDRTNNEGRTRDTAGRDRTTTTAVN
jgi:hypothetical protein